MPRPAEGLRASLPPFVVDENGTAHDHALAVLRGHIDRIESISFAAGDRLLLSSSWDGSARLFDLSALERDPRSLLPTPDDDSDQSPTIKPDPP